MSDMDRLYNFLNRLAPSVQQSLDGGVARLGTATLAQLKLRASGRPGPRRITGDYTRQMNMQADHGAGGVEVSIGTSAVQALRLEYGFVGADSLGRNYNQPPFPHFQPTFTWLEGLTASEIPNLIGTGVRGAM